MHCSAAQLRTRPMCVTQTPLDAQTDTQAMDVSSAQFSHVQDIDKAMCKTCKTEGVLLSARFHNPWWQNRLNPQGDAK